MHKWY